MCTVQERIQIVGDESVDFIRHDAVMPHLTCLSAKATASTCKPCSCLQGLTRKFLKLKKRKRGRGSAKKTERESDE